MKKDIYNKIVNSKFPYVIAEIGINHNGSFKVAKKMIKEAKRSGADCVKFQKFFAKKFISKYAPKAVYQKKNKFFKKKSQLEIIKNYEITFQELIELKKYSEKLKIDFLCTPFENDSLNELLGLKVKIFKISSDNLNNFPFLNKVAKSKKPVILSTGMSNLKEVGEAFKIFKRNKVKIIILQCTSNYPSEINDANINVLKTFKRKFKVPVGYSDHTLGSLSSIVAVSLGAIVIEKHFTLSKKMRGLDHKASLEPSEFKKFVNNLKKAKIIMGSYEKFPSKNEKKNSAAARRSIVVTRNLKKNHKIKLNDVEIKRPGIGINPKYLTKIIGKKINKEKKIDSILRKDDFKGLKFND